MIELDQLQLISNENVVVDNNIVLHPPLLKDIREVGIHVYDSYLGLLSLDLNSYIQIMKLEEAFSKIDESSRAEMTIFDLLVVKSDTRESLIEALSFFLDADLIFDDKLYKLVAHNKDEKHKDYDITHDNYPDIQDIILSLNHIKLDRVKPKEVKNKRALKILEALQKGREKLQKAKKADSNINIPNLISSIVAYHGAYTYESVWSLTVYQLYDLFSRMDTKNQIGIIGLRWAAWGKDEFDYGIWYKDPNQKNIKETK